MTALIILLVRLALLYIVIRLVWKIVGKAIGTREGKDKNKKDQSNRFNAEGKSIEDGEFKDIS